MRQTLFALLAAFLLLPGCPVANDDDSAGDDDDATANDDDATANDDDATANDDDATADDDDATSDDDDSAGDDDDATSDDDDSAGDDDDSANNDAAVTPDEWLDDAFCLDWSSVSWVSPTSSEIAQAASMGFNLTSVPLMLSPTEVSNGFEMRIAQANTNTCVQNTAMSTAETTGTWADPTFDADPTDLTLALGVGNFPLLNLTIDGRVQYQGSWIFDSEINAFIDMGPGAPICQMANCQACPGSGAVQCLELYVTSADWWNQGTPLTLVP